MPPKQTSHIFEKPENCIYKSRIFHARHDPFYHDYVYDVFGFFIDIDTLNEADKSLKLFSFNHWNITSFYNKDHGKRDGSALRPWIEKAAQEKGLDLSESKIFMLAFPRLWGYVFNPITLFYCYSPDDVLQAILYEVKNTFGDQHGYLLPVEYKENIIKQTADKVFHVSPFIHMDCTYHFAVKAPGDKLSIGIHQFSNNKKILTATWNGTRQTLNDKNILKTILTMPLMTMKVMASIHWQAFRLWIKGARYIRRNNLPNKGVPKKDVS